MINFGSTLAKGLIILAASTVMWEMARNLWLNWGTSYFWASSFVAAVIGVLAWWGIGLAAYLTAPRKADASSEAQHANVTQSATASSGSTVIQAGRDVVINQGVSESTVQKILSERAILASRELTNKYPLGWVLMGISDGKVIFHPEPEVLQFDPQNKVLISIDEQQVTWLTIVFFKVFTGEVPGGVVLDTMRLDIGYEENVMKRFPMNFNLGNVRFKVFAEILDGTNKIFVLGFQSN